MNEINNQLLKSNFLCFINKTPLYIAVEKGNIDVVQVLLANKDVNVNIKSI